MTETNDLGPCPICGRPMIDGPSVDRHHWVPKSKGGRDVAVLHTVCHRKIHSVLSETELARNYATADALKAHPDIAAFIAWVRKKPPEFLDWSKAPKKRKGA